jgi:hypothetical protein
MDAFLVTYEDCSSPIVLMSSYCYDVGIAY